MAMNSVETVTEDIRAEENGLLNGMLPVSLEPFNSYISEAYNEEYAENKLRIIDRSLVDKKRKVSKLEAQVETLKDKLLGLRKARAKSEERIHLNEKLTQREHEAIAENKTAKEKIIIRYGWIVTLILVLAAVTFTAADIVVTHDIVSRGLRMPKAEAWIFAAALSMIVVMLKPVYDRLFERGYYAKGSNKKPTHRLLVTVSILALITIGIMGAYRNVNLNTQRKKSDLDSELSQVREEPKGFLKEYPAINDGTPGSRTELEDPKKKRENIAKEIRELSSKGTEGIIPLLIFTLTCIVFSLAGTICLGIGLPSLERLMKRRSYSRKVKKSNRRLTKRLLPRLTKLNTALNQQNIEIEEIHKALVIEEELKSEKDNIAALEATHSDAVLHLSETKKRKMQNLYLNAYIRGTHLSMTGDMELQARRVQNALFGTAEGAPMKTGGPKGTRNNGSGKYDNDSRRPYIILRKMIADGSGEKKNGIIYDQD